MGMSNAWRALLGLAEERPEPADQLSAAWESIDAHKAVSAPADKAQRAPENKGRTVRGRVVRRGAR